MARFRHEDDSFEIDDDGFLIDPDLWTPELGAAMAAADGIAELGDEHRRVMNFIREHWLAHGAAPMIRVLCRETGLSLLRIYDLFPDGPTRGACRYAGLPKPDGCV